MEFRNAMIEFDGGTIRARIDGELVFEAQRDLLRSWEVLADEAGDG